ncbi:MAG: hypothetical protein K8T10_03145 [Candidatus Eremiobacteraeota bacterium]|nr:hypothetical protein [Candidatus Eremiobacteraeota bacterium]
MIDQLINTKNPYSFDDSRDKLFLSAMRENFRQHYDNCPQYRKLCILEGLSPDNIINFEDIFHIPHLFVSVLKDRTFKSVPDNQVKLTLKSSGTRGQKSAIYLDSITLDRIHNIVWNIFDEYGMADKSVECNCILFSYEHKFASDVGTAFSDKLLSGLTGIKNLVYVLRRDEENNDFYFDIEGLIDALLRFSKEDNPLRIIGFPALLFELEKEYTKRGLPNLNFGKDSYIIIGGGWKTKAKDEIPKPIFKNIMSRLLGVPVENVRDLFGMVEHGVPYVECEKGNMHVPIYSRAVVRDPETLKILPDYQPGLLHFYTPYLNSFPAISLLTTDVGMTGRDCPCGRNAPYIIVLGRAGLEKHRGCAIRALDFISGGVDK